MTKSPSEINGHYQSAYREGMQIAFDSSSLNPAFECGRKYYYSILCGYRRTGDNVHFSWGGYLHRGREIFFHALSSGEDFEQAVRSTVKKILVEAKDWKSNDSYKNKFTLIRALVWYFDKWRSNPLEIITLASGRPAVELSFQFPIDLKNPWGDPYVICGHLDALAKFHPNTWVLDTKSSKHDLDDRFFAQFTPSIQFPLYTIAANIVYHQPVVGVICDGVQTLVGGTRFKRAPIQYPPDWLNEFFATVLRKIKEIERWHQERFFPMNPTACDKYGGCQFREICRKHPDVRQLFLDDATRWRRESWEPLKARGEA